jgi:Entner-Doudoroff aldolase
VKTQEFLEILWRERATAIMRAGSAEVARQGMAAAIRGGFGVVEFTMTTPDVLELISEVAAGGAAVVGAGTVLSVADARAAVGAGAAFLVSPVVDEDVIAEAARLGVTMIPGCATPTEMARAHGAGAPLQKVFPALEGGPEAVRAILGPLPFLRLVPTNGVDLDNADAYLEAGAFAVGFVRALFDGEDLRTQAWDRVEERARAMKARLEAVPRSAAVPS